jgi:TMC domain
VRGEGYTLSYSPLTRGHLAAIQRTVVPVLSRTSLRWMHTQVIIQIIENQALVWLGSSMAPLLPLFGVAANVVTFYSKRFLALWCYKPPEKQYSASRTSNMAYNLMLRTCALVCACVCVCVCVCWGGGGHRLPAVNRVGVLLGFFMDLRVARHLIPIGTLLASRGLACERRCGVKGAPPPPLPQEMASSMRAAGNLQTDDSHKCLRQRPSDCVDCVRQSRWRCARCPSSSTCSGGASTAGRTRGPRCARQLTLQSARAPGQPEPRRRATSVAFLSRQSQAPCVPRTVAGSGLWVSMPNRAKRVVLVSAWRAGFVVCHAMKGRPSGHRIMAGE